MSSQRDDHADRAAFWREQGEVLDRIEEQPAALADLANPAPTPAGYVTRATEAVRQAVHQTLHPGAYTEPSDGADMVNGLGSLVGMLPQLLDQLDHYLHDGTARGVFCLDNLGEPMPVAAYVDHRAALLRAIQHAAALTQALGEAQLGRLATAPDATAAQP